MHHLDDFVAAARVLWREYQQCGPGRLAASQFDAVESASAALLESSAPEETKVQVRALTDLCQRCACRPEGLSFIAGEYGLIPRKDQHAKFESLLEDLSAES